MIQSDPTDQTLAAIASILDQPESHREPDATAVDEKPDDLGAVEPDGYSKLGPGPMAAIRFKWSVRREDDGAALTVVRVDKTSAAGILQRRAQLAHH